MNNGLPISLRKRTSDITEHFKYPLRLNVILQGKWIISGVNSRLVRIIQFNCMSMESTLY